MALFGVAIYYSSTLLADCYHTVHPKSSATTAAVALSSGVDICTPVTQKLWHLLQALCNIAFAYSFSNVLIEIQDTIKEAPPSEAAMTKKAMAFYVMCGCMGYAAFGNDAPDNLLTGFSFYEPFWLVDVANATIVVHLVGAYQVFCQPIFAFIERWAAVRWLNIGFVTPPSSSIGPPPDGQRAASSCRLRRAMGHRQMAREWLRHAAFVESWVAAR
ncbi:amino acid permease 3-like [Hordeum vulgare]|nr:amino acid permease 3-like [Hordeum vulgare]